jgi:hypothetical protein
MPTNAMLEPETREAIEAVLDPRVYPGLDAVYGEERYPHEDTDEDRLELIERAGERASDASAAEMVMNRAERRLAAARAAIAQGAGDQRGLALLQENAARRRAQFTAQKTELTHSCRRLLEYDSRAGTSGPVPVGPEAAAAVEG